MLSPITWLVFTYITLRHLIKIKNKTIRFGSIFLTLILTQFFNFSSFVYGGMIGDYPKYVFFIWLIGCLSLIFFTLFSIIIDLTLFLLNIIFIKKKKMIYNSKYYLLTFIISIIFVSISAYHGQKVPNITETTIYSSKVSKEYKIIQLTDLHIGKISNYEWLKQVISKVNNQDPDVVLITGDLADGNPNNYIKTVSLLSGIKSKYGIYAVTGNHEYYYNYNGWMDLYNKNGINFLFNKNINIEDLTIAGVPDIISERFGHDAPNIDKALSNSDKNKYTILLDHRPGSFTNNSENKKIDLQLSGHTHGGMLPILEDIVAKYNNGYVAGEYKNNGSILNLSNGAGIWAGFPLRLFHDSEINVINIKPDLK